LEIIDILEDFEKLNLKKSLKFKDFRE